VLPCASTALEVAGYAGLFAVVLLRTAGGRPPPRPGPTSPGPGPPAATQPAVPL
jgi:hypothetical protein